MNKSLTKPLIRPLGGRWARVCLTALLTTVVTVGAQAQATCESGMQARTAGQGGTQAQATVESGTPSRTQMQTQTQTRACADSPGGAQARTACDIVLTPPRDLNSELRHRTWSVYTQGGLS